MAFVYAYFFSDILCFDMSLLLLTVTLRGVSISNKHCLLSFFFHFILIFRILLFECFKTYTKVLLHIPNV